MNQLTHILAIGLICVCTLSHSAQGQPSHRSLSTSISDDNRAYAVRVEGLIDGRAIHYQQQFDVTGMSQTEKDSIKARIFDSLGLIESPKPPVPPTFPAPPEPASVVTADEADATGQAVTFVCSDCTGKIRLEIVGKNFEYTRDATGLKGGEKVFPLAVPMSPGEYTYQYWQNGELQMQLPFTVKAGEPNKVSIK